METYRGVYCSMHGTITKKSVFQRSKTPHGYGGYDFKQIIKFDPLGNNYLDNRNTKKYTFGAAM